MNTTWCLITRHNNPCVIDKVLPRQYGNPYMSPMRRACTTGPVTNLYAISARRNGCQVTRSVDITCFRLSQRRSRAGIITGVILDGMLPSITKVSLMTQVDSAFFGTLPTLISPEAEHSRRT